MSIIEQLPKERFKATLIFFSLYVFAYIVIGFFINLVLNFKSSIFSEKSLINSVMNEMLINNKKTKGNENVNIKDEIKKSLNKKNYCKIGFFAILNIIKMSKNILLIIIFGIYFLGSVKFFLLNIDVEIVEKTNSNTSKKDSIEDNSPSVIQNFLFLSDLLFSNYNAYGIYGNTQEEINSALGRSELEIEYTTEINQNSWKTINFEYKLGPKNSNPKFLFFYTPRLDFKINSAANEEDLNADSWIILLLGKIFEKNPVVMDLLGYETEEKNFYDKISLFEKIKEIYFGKKKYELMSEINKVKIDIFKYQYLKKSEKKNKNKNLIFKRKRYKEYLSPIEKHTLFMVYEKLGLPKPDSKQKIKINFFQFIPVNDLILIFFLGIFLWNKK